MKHEPWNTSLAVLGIFVLLTALLTYPLVFHLSDAVEDGQDALLNVWIMAWDNHALLTDPLRFFDANIFYPYQNTLAYSEINLSQALLALPATLLSGNPVLGYNLALFLTFVLSGWGMYLLARRLTGSWWGGMAAGVIFAFNAYKLSNLAQIQLVSLHWLPFVLYQLAVIRDQGSGVSYPRPLRTVARELGTPHPPISPYLLLTLFLVLQALASFYYAIFTVLAVGLYLVCWFAFSWQGSAWIAKSRPGPPDLAIRWEQGQKREQGQKWTRAALLRLAVAGIVAALVALPFALPYFQVQRELGFQRTLAESEPFSASLKLYVETLPNNLLYGRFLTAERPVVIGGYALDALFPGLVTLLLAGYGAWISRKVWRDSLFYVFLVLFSFVLSLGPALYLNPQTRLDLPFSLPYAWFYVLVPGFQALRAPERFSVLVYLGLAVLAGFSVARIAGNRGTEGTEATGTRAGNNRQSQIGNRKSAILVGLLLLECLTLPAANVYSVPTGDAVPPVYRWLAQQPQTTILELPLGDRDATVTLRYQYLSTYHWQRTPDGYSGFIPPKHGEMAYEMADFPSARSLALLRGYGVQYVVVHADHLAAPLPALPGDLALAQTFGSDQVYRLLPRPGAPRVTVAAYLPPAFVPGQPYTAYLIVQSQGDVPLVTLPTRRPMVQAGWQMADGSWQTEQIPAVFPLVITEAAVVPVRFGMEDGGRRTGAPQSVTIRLDDPIVGHLEASIKPQQVRESAGFPIPARLVQAATDKKEYRPGETVRLSLRWRALGKIDAYYSAFAALVDKDGRPVVRRDGEPQQGKRPTLLWTPGEEIPDEYALTLPPDAAPGRYRVEVGLYRAADLAPALTLDAEGRPLPRLLVGSVKVPLPAVTARPRNAVNAVLDGQIALLGYDIAASDQRQGEATVTLYWQALQALDQDYTVFLHVLGADGKIASQQDSQPLGGQYPTGVWSPGEVVADTYTLPLPPGEHRLAVGMYDLGTMTRLKTGASDDKVTLGLQLP